MRPFPVPSDESKRLAALPGFALFGTDPEREYDLITAMVADLTGSPICLISIVGEDTQWMKSRYGLAIPSTPRDVAFCGHTILADQPLVVPDALRDARFRDNSLVTQHPNIRFYAGAPIIAADGVRLGALCIIDTKPRHGFQSEDLLERFAAIVAERFDQRRLRLVAKASLNVKPNDSESVFQSSTALSLAHRLLHLRKELKRLFDPDLFVDPGLMTLLNLFIAGEEGRELSRSQCFSVAGVPPTTGQRLLSQLEQRGLISQDNNPFDRRRVDVRLTAAATDRMRVWLTSLTLLPG